MSRDIFVQDIPPGVTAVAEIPQDFEPRMLPCSRSEVIRVIRSLAPHANASDAAWVTIESNGSYHIEVNLGAEEALDSFAFHVRGGVEAEILISRILRELGLRAFDVDSDCGIFEPREA